MEENGKNLEQDILKWKEQEQKYGKLFSKQVLSSTSFKRERLKQLLAIEAKYDKNNIQDPTVLALLKLEKRELQKQVAPNVIMRLFQRVLDRFKLEVNKKQYKQQHLADMTEIRSTLQRTGLGKHGDRAEELLSGNHSQSTSLDHREQIGPDQKIEYSLSFRNQKFEGYKMAYTDEKQHLRREYFFRNEGYGTTPVDQAAMLLSGRAIKENNQWIQMDFNDRGADGNFKLIRFGQEQLDEKMGDVIAKLPIKDLLTAEDRSRMVEELSKGNRIPITLTNKKEEIQATILADPRHASIIVLDKEGKVLDPFQLNASNTVTRTKK